MGKCKLPHVINDEVLLFSIYVELSFEKKKSALISEDKLTWVQILALQVCNFFFFLIFSLGPFLLTRMTSTGIMKSESEQQCLARGRYSVSFSFSLLFWLF